eukprot:scaffold84876_cov19-Tisochrysis_lutea.AAC.1
MQAHMSLQAGEMTTGLALLYTKCSQLVECFTFSLNVEKRTCLLPDIQVPCTFGPMAVVRDRVRGRISE